MTTNTTDTHWPSDLEELLPFPGAEFVSDLSCKTCHWTVYGNRTGRGCRHCGWWLDWAPGEPPGEGVGVLVCGPEGMPLA
jgi:hypothetical protein